MMKIAVITREKIEFCPPLLSVVEILSDMKEDVTLITSGITKTNEKTLSDKGTSVILLQYSMTDNVLQRLLRVICYKIKLQKVLKQNKYELLWIEGAGTFRISTNVIEQYPFVMQISELYDYSEAKPVIKAIEKLIHKAKAIVMPEYNRGLIYKAKFGLNNPPFILPNKLYFYLNGEELKYYENKYKDELILFHKKKVILYQGIIAEERDLTPYITAISKLDEEYVLVLLGPDRGMLDKYKNICPQLVHIDFIPAPDYLVFTAHAYIGILTYAPTSLNCVFCAPNKIFEYGCYGLPMIGNKIPGLSETIGKYNAGVLVDESVDSIISGIETISSNYSEYSKNARNLFNDTDNVKTVQNILKYTLENNNSDRIQN